MKSGMFEARFLRRLFVSVDFTRRFDYHAASVPQPQNSRIGGPPRIAAW
jgi:hypothetical protein